jgi:tetratricopeptide (TPR) repeat protein
LRVAPEATLRRLPQAALAQTAELLPLLIERLPDLPALPPATPAERHNRLLDGLVDLALALAQEQPLAVICDDAQWADEATLTAIGRLARRAPRRALLVMLIYRSEELADNPALHALLRSLGREMLLRPLLPARLNRSEIARYLATMADAEPGPILRLADRLVARTGGNPLFVTVALQALLEEYQAASLAELLPSLANDAPLPDLAGAPPIRDLVLSRLSHLTEGARELIEQIAVIGRPVSLDLVEQLAGAAALDDAQLLLDRQFLVEGADSRLTFGHELVRSTIAASLASPRRRRLHRRAAEAIAALHGEHPGKAAELALHFAAAGRGTEAEVLRHALRAGDQTRRSFGYHLALDQYNAAIAAAERLGAAAPADEVQRAFAGRLLTYEALLDWNGIMATSAQYKRWRAAYHPATPAPEEGHPEPLVTPRRLVLLRALMGDLAGAAVLSAERENGKPGEREGGQTAEPWMPGGESPILRDMLRRTAVILQPRTPVDVTPGGLRSSVAPMYPCLPALPVPGDPAHDLPALLGPDDAALALFQVGWAALMQGLLSQAEPCLQRAFDLGIETGQAAAAVVSALQLSHLYGLRGSAEERDEWLQQSLDLAQRAQEAAWASIWPRIHQGFVWLLDDQIGAALQRFEHLEVQLVDLPTFQSHRAGVQVGLGLVALARGDLSGAARRLRDALAAPQALYGYVYAVAQHGMAQIAARRGDLQTARDTLARTLDDSARRGLVAEYVRTAIEIARIERDYGDPALTLLLLRSAADLAAEAGMRPLAEAAATLLAKLS